MIFQPQVRLSDFDIIKCDGAYVPVRLPSIFFGLVVFPYIRHTLLGILDVIPLAVLGG